jgi:MFS transporter, DHA1 family, multidrug resistance protein
MKDIIRDSTIGQLIRWISRNKVLQYVEETPGFHCPHCYANSSADEKSISRQPSDLEKVISGPVSDPTSSAHSGNEIPVSQADSLERSETQSEDTESGHQSRGMWKIPTQAELQETYSQAAASERPVSRPIEPAKTSDGTILVDWYTTGAWYLFF